MNCKKKLLSFLNVNISDDNVFAIAGIHASIISILFGLSIAYVLHINSQISQIENDSISIVEDVNDITFSPIWFKLVSPSGLFLEKWSSKDDQIQGWLSHYWSDPSGELMDDFIDGPPFKVYFSELKLNHTEFKLCIMGSLALEYPFPERMVIKDKKLKGLSPAPAITFKDMEDIRRWNEEVKNKFQSIVGFMNWFGSDTLINGFDWSKEINLHNKLWEKDSGESYDQKTLTEFQVIPKEFCLNVRKIYDISKKLDNKINRFNYLNNLNPSNSIILFFIIFVISTFVASIIVPIIHQPVKKFYIIWLPTGFYCFFFIYSAFKVISVLY